MEPDQGQKLIVAVKGLSKRIVSGSSSGGYPHKVWEVTVQYRDEPKIHKYTMSDNDYKIQLIREKLELQGADISLLDDLEQLAYEKGGDSERENHECDSCEHC
jgi:hypothetical protein